MKYILLLFSVMCLASCGPENNSGKDVAHEKEDQINDSHSFSQPNQALVTHLDLDIKLDFDNKVIEGKASYEIENKGASEIILDIDQIQITKVILDRKNEVKWKLGVEKPHLGQALHIPIDANTHYIEISYKTRPSSRALQWLNPQQTSGKKMPFLFTQGQAILTRTWIPTQDSPGIRLTYSARVQAPEGMLVVMSASNPTEVSNDGIYTFEMEQPIPPYLIALAAGNIVFKEIGPRSGVYAEPDVVDAAAWEFEEVEEMMDVAEDLYGPYRWDRYDIIVLPPSFPFGGMENPRLTFATPTILAGDRSLVALIAHELAHSWSGNLVTNSTWDDFWLNEGFTVYIERRITEAMNGRDYNEMLAILGHQDMVEDVEDIGYEDPDTHLKLHLQGRDPDDGMTDVAYEKGYFFLRMLEEEVGRETFDVFLREYFDEHSFKSLTTEQFIDYLNKELIEPNNLETDVEEWIYNPGIPDNCPDVVSDKFVLVEESVALISEDSNADIETENWTPHEWLHFVRHLPSDMTIETAGALDQRFGFTNSGNSEIKAAWYVKAIDCGYASTIEPEITAFLVEVGRRKFLTPIYKAYKNAGEVGTAREIYEIARPNYHAVATQTMDALLDFKPSKG